MSTGPRSGVETRPFFWCVRAKRSNLGRNFDFVLFGTSPLSVNVVNVAGSAKREKGVALPRTEFYLHELRNTSHSAAVGKVVSVMMDSGRLVLRGHVYSVLPKVFWAAGS